MSRLARHYHALGTEFSDSGTFDLRAFRFCPETYTLCDSHHGRRLFWSVFNGFRASGTGNFL